MTRTQIVHPISSGLSVSFSWLCRAWPVARQRHRRSSRAASAGVGPRSSSVAPGRARCATGYSGYRLAGHTPRLGTSHCHAALLGDHFGSTAWVAKKTAFGASSTRRLRSIPRRSAAGPVVPSLFTHILGRKAALCARNRKTATLHGRSPECQLPPSISGALQDCLVFSNECVRAWPCPKARGGLGCIRIWRI